MHFVASVPLYPPTSRVGAWLATHEFLAGLVRRQHRVDVVTYLAALPAYELDGVTVHPKGALDPLVRVANVVLSHAGDRGEAPKRAQRWGRPSVRLVHGCPADEQLDGAALVVFNSQSSQKQARWDGPSVVCPPPTFPERHRVAATGDACTMVNLSGPKGGELFRLLVPSMPAQRFVGVLGGYGRQIVPTGHNLTVIRPVTDMRQVWSRTRILLMPSESETWGMVAVEAATNGIPVVAHPCDGIIEALGDAPVYVGRSDLSGWRRAITALADDDAYAARSAAVAEAAARHDPHASINRFADAVEAVGSTR